MKCIRGGVCTVALIETSTQFASRLKRFYVHCRKRFLCVDSICMSTCTITSVITFAFETVLQYTSISISYSVLGLIWRYALFPLLEEKIVINWLKFSIYLKLMEILTIFLKNTVQDVKNCASGYYANLP